MSHKTIHRYEQEIVEEGLEHEVTYEQEIVEEDLKHEVTYESELQKGRETTTMYELLGWGTSRSEHEWDQAPAIGIRIDSESVPGGDFKKFSARMGDCDDYVSPRFCKADGRGVVGLLEKNHRNTKRASKRETIPLISRFFKCFRDDTSLKESTAPSCGMVTATESQGNLSCHRDQHRPGEGRDHERIQHRDRKKLIDLTYESMCKSTISKSQAEEERGGVTTKHIKRDGDILLHRQKPVPGSRSSCSDGGLGQIRGQVPEFFSCLCFKTATDCVQESGFCNVVFKFEKKVPVTSVAKTHASREGPTVTEKKEILFSPKQSHGFRIKDLEATAARSKECPPSSSQLQRSTSFLDYFGAERKVERESQAKQREEDLGVVFHEIEGESPRHRKQRYQMFKDLQSSMRARRIIEAMHQQEEARQRERDKKMKAAHELDPQIRKWSHGNEGNLRALLSTLQNVLLPDQCSLSDLLTPGSAKKAYMKASYSLHPDKVQQGGGTVEEIYIAERILEF